jgi:hypothetical protein
MNMSPLNTPMPDAYRAVIDPLIAMARTIMERGETLQAIAFIGNFTRQSVQQVLMNNTSEAAKDASCDLVARVAAQHDADFVFIISEAWALREDKVQQMEQILARYGSISACPYRIDSATFSLETRHGLWFGQATIKPKGLSKKKRTFGEVRFRFFTEAQGRFQGLLPGTAEASKTGTLH